MSAVRWWFLCGLLLHLGGAAAFRSLADDAGADRPVRAGLLTALMYLSVLAAIGNAGLLWLGEQDEPNEGGK